MDEIMADVGKLNINKANFIDKLNEIDHFETVMKYHQLFTWYDQEKQNDFIHFIQNEIYRNFIIDVGNGLSHKNCIILSGIIKNKIIIADDGKWY